MFIEDVGQITLDSESIYSAFGFGLGIGYDIVLAKNIKLEPMIRYAINSYKDKNNEDDYKNSGILLNVGFIYRF